ncbi:hypothetical protein ACWDRR_18360 [Kitasatospora sp. NPDC003701]
MPTTVTRQARVARALDALGPPGAVRVLLSVRLTEKSAEEQEALRSTVGDPADGLHPAEVAEHHRDLERHGLLRTSPAGPEATAAAKELWPVFLAAAGWASKHRPRLVDEVDIVVAVEEVLRIGAHPLTAPVLDRLRSGPATEADLASPMTAAARAQLPDQLSVLVQQELLERLPDGALQATAAGGQLAKVHDTLDDWSGRWQRALPSLTRTEAAAHVLPTSTYRSGAATTRTVLPGGSPTGLPLPPDTGGHRPGPRR